MIRIRPQILRSLALLFLCTYPAWGQERVYGPRGHFSIVALKSWPRKTVNKKYSFSNPPGKAFFALTVETLETSVAKKFVPDDLEAMRRLGYSISEERLVKRPGATFRVVEVDDNTIESNPLRELRATLSGTPHSKGDRTGIIYVLYRPRELSDSELNNLLEAAWSFRLEDGDKRSPPPPPTIPKPVEDDDF